MDYSTELEAKAIGSALARKRRTMISLYTQRRLVNVIYMGLSLAATAFGLFWLVWLLWTLVSAGLPGLRWEVFVQNTPPPGSAGGLANAIVGSLLMTGVGVAIGTPAGVLAGTYLAEFGRNSRIAAAVRFVNDVLLSAPSIIIGVFV
jgi:phosphate transport system permease protein